MNCRRAIQKLQERNGVNPITPFPLHPARKFNAEQYALSIIPGPEMQFEKLKRICVCKYRHGSGNYPPFLTLRN